MCYVPSVYVLLTLFTVDFSFIGVRLAEYALDYNTTN